jgi:hypothetical protein
MSRIYFEKKTADTDRIYGDLNKFFRRSWHQVPDPSSQFRFMKPECVVGLINSSLYHETEVLLQTQSKEGDGSAPRLALYVSFPRTPFPPLP